MSTKIRIRVQGLAFLVVLALLLGLSVASYRKAFTDVAHVTLETDTAGNQLQEASDVKIRGVIVAGSMVTQGKVLRSGFARLFRDGTSIWEGKVAALKRFKEDVKEVSEGFECGISLDGYSEMKEKDIIESFEIEEIKQRL